MTTTRKQLRQLVDALPDNELAVAAMFLQYLCEGRADPVLLAHATAPWDDEPITPEEEAAVEEARRDIRESRPWEEVRRELGLD